MNCFCTIFLGLAAWLTSLAAVHGGDTRVPRTDLYGDPLPPGAVARLGTIRLRHADSDVTFSKDGKQLISCGSDGAVRVWDVATGKLLQHKRLKIRFDAEVEKMVLSATGAMAAAGGFKIARLYDTSTSKENGRFSIAGRVESLTFSPNDQFLALVIDDGQHERLLQVGSTNPFKRGRTCGTVASSPVVFTTDGKRIAGIGADEKIRIWDTATGKEILDSSERTETPGPALAFSPDGKVLAVGSKSNGIVRLLDAGLLKTTSILKPPANDKAHFIDWLVFAPDGRHLAGAYHEDSDAPFPEEYGLLVWDTAGDKQARRIPERYGIRMRFAPNGKTLACWDAATGEIRLWDVASGRPLQRWPEHGCCVEALTVSTDGKILASCDSTGRLCLWDIAAGKLRRALQGRDGWMGTPFCLFFPGR